VVSPRPRRSGAWRSRATSCASTACAYASLRRALWWPCTSRPASSPRAATLAVRATVYDLLGELRSWVFPVGRLDRDSAGLLILTDDHRLGTRSPTRCTTSTRAITCVCAASWRRKRWRYSARVCLGATAARPAPRACALGVNRDGTSWIEITLTEGRNRSAQMCGAARRRAARARCASAAWLSATWRRAPGVDSARTKWRVCCVGRGWHAAIADRRTIDGGRGVAACPRAGRPARAGLEDPEEVDAFLAGTPTVCSSRLAPVTCTDNALEILEGTLGARADIPVGLIRVVEAARRVNESPNGPPSATPRADRASHTAASCTARDNWDISREALSKPRRALRD